MDATVQSPARISELLVEAAALDDEIGAVAQTADDSWVVRFEGVDVEVGLDPESNQLVLVTTVGLPNPERRLAILEGLMAFNFLLRETGGVRMAMTGTDGDVVQMVDLGLSDLTAGTLA